MSSRDARKPGGARANWSIVGNYIVQNVEKTKELNIRSVKKGPVTPSNPVIVVAEPVAQPIAAEEITREESAIENGTSIITRSPTNLPLLTLSSSFHSI